MVETSRSKSNGLIVDTRPMLNAMANRAQGKGYENAEHYTKCEFQFLGIENIHVMRKSLEKLENEGWLKADWLNHVYAVLDVSNKVKHAISEGRTVIVHCSDGWDRTSQVCSGKPTIKCKIRPSILRCRAYALSKISNISWIPITYSKRLAEYGAQMC